jgi:signal peptidase II
MTARKLLLLILVLLAGVILDLVTKLWVMQALPLGAQIPVVKGFFNLVHVHNRGVAFGLLAGWSASFARLFFICTTCLVLVVVGYLWWRLPPDHWPAALGYSLIFTGAVGNLVDRIRWGEVVDFLDVYWGRYHWPAFNVADSLVCVGAGILIWVILREKDVHVSRTA